MGLGGPTAGGGGICLFLDEVERRSPSFGGKEPIKPKKGEVDGL